MVTTDAVGRQVTTSVPFYISNTLLKPGLFDYSLSLGKIREDYGLKNFSYGKFASAADARYGVNDWLTVEGRTELSSDLQLLGAGSVLKLANLGVLSASFTQSKADKSMSEDRTKDLEGNQYTVGYSYNRNRFGFSINHNQRDDEYTDLSRLQYSNLISVNSNKSLTANTYFATKTQELLASVISMPRQMTLKSLLKLVLGAYFTDLYEWCDCFIKCQP